MSEKHGNSFVYLHKWGDYAHMKHLGCLWLTLSINLGYKMFFCHLLQNHAHQGSTRFTGGFIMFVYICKNSWKTGKSKWISYICDVQPFIWCIDVMYSHMFEAVQYSIPMLHCVCVLIYQNITCLFTVVCCVLWCFVVFVAQAITWQSV